MRGPSGDQAQYVDLESAPTMFAREPSGFAFSPGSVLLKTPQSFGCHARSFRAQMVSPGADPKTEHRLIFLAVPLRSWARKVSLPRHFEWFAIRVATSPAVKVVLLFG